MALPPTKKEMEKIFASDVVLAGIDIEKGFAPGGGLAISNAAEIVGVWNKIVVRFSADRVVMCKDFHPEGHDSFLRTHQDAKNVTLKQVDGLWVATWNLPDGTEHTQNVWPTHCVKGTRDVEFIDGLIVPEGTKIYYKGELLTVDSYGIAGDAHGRKFEKTEYEADMRTLGIKHVIFMGLALRFCVTFSALQTQEMGIQSYVVLDGCRAIDPHQTPKEMAAIVKELTDAGVIVVQSISDLDQIPALWASAFDVDDKSSSSALAENEITACAAAGGGAATTGQ
jgi:nicotinamidase/pyrazinamidase